MIYYCRFCSKRFKKKLGKCWRCERYKWTPTRKDEYMPVGTITELSSLFGKQWAGAAKANLDILTGKRSLPSDRKFPLKVAMMRYKFFSRLYDTAINTKGKS